MKFVRDRLKHQPWLFLLFSAISQGFFKVDILVEIQQISLMIAYENDQNNSLRVISKSITNNCTLSPKVNISKCQC